jgi:hypothetical protein
MIRFTSVSRFFLLSILLLSLCSCAPTNKDVAAAWQSTAAAWQSVFTIIGLLGAGVFFAYKAWVGFNNLNLSISLSSDRKPASDESDYVAVTISIEKGANAAVSLLCVEVRFTPSLDDKQPRQIELHRLEVDATRSTVDWTQKAENHPALYVSLGERTQFASYCRVPLSEPCLVEVVIYGRKRLSNVQGFVAQWRGSVVSLPNSGPTTPRVA